MFSYANPHCGRDFGQIPFNSEQPAPGGLLGLANEIRERLVELPRLLVEQQVTAVLERVEAGASNLRGYASAHLDPFLVNVRISREDRHRQPEGRQHPRIIAHHEVGIDSHRDPGRSLGQLGRNPSYVFVGGSPALEHFAGKGRSEL